MAAKNGPTKAVVVFRSLNKVIQLHVFVCKCCTTGTLSTDVTNNDKQNTGNAVLQEKVGNFNADAGRDLAMTARVRSAWKKLREYLPVIGKGFSLKLKGKVYYIHHV